MLQNLTHAQFEPLLGQSFSVGNGGPTLELTAVKVVGETRFSDRLPFALTFRGGSTVMPQATYPLAHPDLGVLELFLVPVGRQAAGVEYEAIFT